MRPFERLEAQLETGPLCAEKRVLWRHIDAASPLRRVIRLRLTCRENRWQQRESATGAAAGRARRRRGPRRRQSSSPGTARGRAAAGPRSTRSPRPCRTTGPRTLRRGETSAARCGEKSAITVSATGGGPAGIGRRPCSRSASPGTWYRSPRRSAPAAPVLYVPSRVGPCSEARTLSQRK